MDDKISLLFSIISLVPIFSSNNKVSHKLSIYKLLYSKIYNWVLENMLFFINPLFIKNVLISLISIEFKSDSFYPFFLTDNN